MAQLRTPRGLLWLRVCVFGVLVTCLAIVLVYVLLSVQNEKSPNGSAEFESIYIDEKLDEQTKNDVTNSDLTPQDPKPASSSSTISNLPQDPEEQAQTKEETPVIDGGQSVQNETPLPESSPVAEVVKIGQNNRYGISVGDKLTGLSEEELNTWLDDMASLGVTWIRLDFDWSWIERNPDRPIDWSRIDRVVNAARARNFELLPILLFTPPWARQEECSYSNRCLPSDPGDFAAFAFEAANRYASKGVRHWEIWNEPNIRKFWLPHADPEEYVKLLSQATKAIHTADPTAIIISAGLAPSASKNGNMAPVEFLEGIYVAGGGTYIDAVGFHPYSFPVLPSYEQSWNAWQQMYATEKSIQSVMRANGDGNKKIWITEFGAPTGGPGSVADSNHDYVNEPSDHVTESFQADILHDAINEVKSYDFVGPFFWYSYKDDGTSQSTIENFFGVLRADGSRKPAYYELGESIK